MVNGNYLKFLCVYAGIDECIYIRVYMQTGRSVYLLTTTTKYTQNFNNKRNYGLAFAKHFFFLIYLHHHKHKYIFMVFIS